MKVICIDADNIPFNEQPLKEGEIYTVICDAPFGASPGYILKEAKHSADPFFGYKKIRFIPLSNIDEAELINQRKEECIQ